MAGRGCSEPGCTGQHTARGFCHRHYRQYLRSGDAERRALNRIYGLTDEQRFWHYVEKGPRCWEWTGYRNAKGYGVLNLSGERVLAHRMAYQMVAEIPDGMSVLHHCDNPGCVKFKHLWLGTKADNNADMEAKGRRRNGDARGTKNPAARLTEDDIRAIRASTERSVDLAAKYGVSRHNIWAIRRRLYWPHIE